MRKIAAGSAGVVVAILVLGVWLAADYGSSGRAQTPAEVGNRTKSISVAPSPFSTPAEASAHDEIAPPPSVKAAEAFDFALSCARYSRLRAFFDQATKDPNSALNSEATASSLSDDQLQALRSNLQYVESREQQCGGIPDSDRVAGYRLYRLADETARQGNMQAAACFVLAQWPVQPTSEMESQEFANYYATSAKQLMVDGVRHGNWKVVNAAVAAARTQHGLQESIAFTDEERYYWYRLSQLGAPTANWESMMGYEAASLAKSLGGAFVARAESRAISDFARYFKNRKMNESDLASCEV